MPWSVMLLLHPMLTPGFEVFQSLLLLRRQILRDLSMGLSQHLANMFAGVAANFFQLGPGFIDDRADLGHLFVGQTQLPAQPTLHRLGGDSGMGGKHEVMPDCHAHENSRRSAGDENQQKTGDKFPLQRAVHCATSSWIAESAIENSLPDANNESLPLLNSR